MARTHDQLYLSENRYENVKEYFKFCASFVTSADNPRVLCDFGCAAGEFPYYLNKIYPNDTVMGMDLLPELIDKARREVPGVQFVVGSVEDRAALPENTADISFLSGVHSIFDDPTIAFGNLIHWTRPGGTVIFFGLFNPYPVDVFLRVRTIDQPADHREAGWNMISQATTTAFLTEHPQVLAHQYHPFTIGIDLPPQKDPLRSWTELMGDGHRQIVSGIGLIHHFYALIVTLK